MNHGRRAAFALLAAMTAIAPCAARAQKPGEQSAQNLEKTITRVVKANYLLYLPREYGQDPARKWPTILFLHGSGESGSDVEKVKKHGPPKLVAAGKEFPFIIISPQAPTPRIGWQVETLNTLLDDVMQKYAVDPDRVYLTGLSMGGFGTWTLATANPERFAAIAPCCGGGDPFRASRRLREMPIWVFHGAKDPTVPIKQSQDMVDALKAAGADVKFTIYPEAGHDCWTATYDNPELYTWFLSHKRKRSEPAK